MDTTKRVNQLMKIREAMMPAEGFVMPRDEAAEGGCGVIGFASSEQIAARHMLSALAQMRNRGNGKGGGIAAAGLVAEEFGVSQAVLEKDYLIVVGYMDNRVRKALEKEFIEAPFHVDHVHEFKTVKDWQAIEGLDVRPPDVACYFVRLKDETVAAFKQAHDTSAMRSFTRTPSSSTSNTINPTAISRPSCFRTPGTCWCSRWWALATMLFATTRSRTCTRMSGSATIVTRPRAGCGIRAARILSSA
jgi:hypothetical protein